jgi:hypothetical protein
MNTKRIWYSSKSNFTSTDTIHQTLMFGTLREIRSLKKTVGINTIKKLFLDHPKKIYTASALNFIKNFILHITSPVDEQKYLKHSPRRIR